MIDINSFESFLINTFPLSEVTIDNFKQDVKFIDIDCFLDQPYTLAIALSTDDIRFATVGRDPKLDFSPYDYVFKTFEDARLFILKIVETGKYQFRQFE